jgi:hypothetical protein
MDPKCTAFHFYLLDPGAKDNCWIWTQEGYSGNGKERAFCWVKENMDHVVTDDEYDIDKKADIAHRKKIDLKHKEKMEKEVC